MLRQLVKRWKPKISNMILKRRFRRIKIKFLIASWSMKKIPKNLSPNRRILKINLKTSLNNIILIKTVKFHRLLTPIQMIKTISLSYKWMKSGKWHKFLVNLWSQKRIKSKILYWLMTITMEMKLSALKTPSILIGDHQCLYQERMRPTRTLQKLSRKLMKNIILVVRMKARSKKILNFRHLFTFKNCLISMD